jgi:phospholipase/carboxylesterase
MNSKVYKENKSNLEYLKVDNQSKNLVILFHGYGASMQDLYGLADVMPTERPCDWIFPNGLLEIPLGMGITGRGWFPVDMAQLELSMQTGSHRDFSDKTTDEFQHALEVTNTFFLEVAKDYDQIIIGGFSQGAMITSFVSLMNSDQIKGYLCLSGTLVGRPQMISLLEKAHKFPFFQSHGTQDPVLAASFAKAQYDLFTYAGFKGEFLEFSGAHEIPMSVIKKSIEFLDKNF